MRFKVLQIPEGEAPLDIRSEWVDVTLPVSEVLGARTGYGVLTGEEATMEKAIAIPLKDAIEALRLAGREKAARWWRQIPQGELLFEESWGELLRDES